MVDVKIDRENPYLGFIPIRFNDKGSYVNSLTKEYDTQAFKYLSWALYPLLGGYAIYSLVYEEHKGWYSWVLSMLYGFLLTFGKSQFNSFEEWMLSLIFLFRRFHYDDTSAIHQLQTQVSCPPTLAHVDVQGIEHIYRRYIRLRH